MQKIVENAEEWNVDTDKIAAIGFSAGGHLCAALATMGKIRPAAVILGYPCILESISHILAEPVPSLDEKVDANTPPAFIFHAAEDGCVPVEHSLAFGTALAKAGSGDVLAGLIASASAYTDDPLISAGISAYLHGAAGDRLADELTEYGVTPSDLPKEVCRILREILER
jgi:acetyl esterase/lipase